METAGYVIRMSGGGGGRRGGTPLPARLRQVRVMRAVGRPEWRVRQGRGDRRTRPTKSNAPGEPGAFALMDARGVLAASGATDQRSRLKVRPARGLPPGLFAGTWL